MGVPNEATMSQAGWLAFGSPAGEEAPSREAPLKPAPNPLQGGGGRVASDPF